MVSFGFDSFFDHKLDLPACDAPQLVNAFRAPLNAAETAFADRGRRARAGGQNPNSQFLVLGKRRRCHLR